MKYRSRIYYSEKQIASMWDRYEKGESLHAIARLFDRSHCVKTRASPLIQPENSIVALESGQFKKPSLSLFLN